jgi:hypothetical protein
LPQLQRIYYLNKHQEGWQLNNKQVADKIYKKKKKGGKNTARTSKAAAHPIFR